MQRTFTWYSDPGHGWLKVNREDIEELGIEEKISACSYQTPGKRVVYLEEDCDAGIFLRAYKEHFGHSPQFKEAVERTNASRIRNLYAYQNEHYCFQ
jgi:hypothetical protein